MSTQNKKKWNITLIFLIGLFLIITLLNTIFGPKLEEISYSELLKLGDSDQLSEVIIDGNRIYSSPIVQENANPLFPKMYLTISIGDDENFARRIQTWNLDNYGGKADDTTTVSSAFFSWVLPLALLIGIWYFVYKAMSKRMGNPMEFGKNKEKVYAQKDTGVTFDDVAGQREAKEQLQELVGFLHNPDEFTSLGATMPKGALLVGPPGTGKTLLAKAVAGEAEVPFFSMSGPEFVQMFVGVGASRVRDLFTQAQKKAPCIVFIDEIDAIGKSRASQASTNDEREQTLNQLLTELDGFDANTGVVILAATNRPEVLDEALLRPGRFDRRVIVDKPDLKGRKAIFSVHTKKVTLDSNIDLLQLAKTTAGAVGADIANIVNEAALLAVKANHTSVMQSDFMEAIEINIAGAIKKDRILSPSEKKAVSYHEIGHALVASMLKNTDPVHKITIIPRTKGALGYTMQLPTEEKFLVTKDELLDRICVMLAGRSGEEIALDTISTGAANDIERATQSVRRMISLYGMSEEFDMMALEVVPSEYLISRPISTCSDETSAKIDGLVLKIIKEQHRRALTILQENRITLDKCTEYLLDKETIDGDEFIGLLDKYKA